MDLGSFGEAVLPEFRHSAGKVDLVVMVTAQRRCRWVIG